MIDGTADHVREAEVVIPETHRNGRGFKLRRRIVANQLRNGIFCRPHVYKNKAGRLICDTILYVRLGGRSVAAKFNFEDKAANVNFTNSEFANYMATYGSDQTFGG